MNVILLYNVTLLYDIYENALPQAVKNGKQQRARNSLIMRELGGGSDFAVAFFFKN